MTPNTDNLDHPGSLTRGVAPEHIYWGARAIGQRINRNERATFHLLESGALHGAKKMNGKWAYSEKAAREDFGP
jgi:hypothetical protein